MEDTARRVRELQAEAEATAEDVAQSKKERVRASLQLKKQQRTLNVWTTVRVQRWKFSKSNVRPYSVELGCGNPLQHRAHP